MMIYTLTGTVSERQTSFFVVACGGVGFQVLSNTRTLSALPHDGKVKIFCSAFFRDEEIQLFGFLDEQTLRLFQLLNTVASVGPKTALGILDLDSVENIMAAIVEKRSDVLSRASGIGTKTAERIILELHNKIALSESGERAEKMGMDVEVEEVLANLGYPRQSVRNVLQGLPKVQDGTIEVRLRATLRELGKPR